MKVALVSTHVDEFPAEFQGTRVPEEPLDLMYTAADLRRRGHDVVLADRTPEGERALAEADAVVLSTTSGYLQWNNHPLGLAQVTQVWSWAARHANDRATKIGYGPHVPAHGGELKEMGLDFVIRGEAELEVGNLLENLSGGVAHDDLCAGLLRADGTFGAPAVVSDMDVLPCPAYQDTVAGAYNAHNHPGPVTTGHLYECSRGCPFQCSFCNTITHRRQYRTKSMETIRRDLTQLAEFSPKRYVYFIDESFAAKGRWFEDVLPVLRELPFDYGCQGNLAFIDSPLLEGLAEAGFVNIEFGYETADEGLLKVVGKNNRLTRAAETINRAAELGISPLLFMQVGLPGETRDSLARNLEFLSGLDPRTRVSIAMPTPYRDTALWKMGVDSGLIPADARGSQLYDFTGLIGHDLPFTQEKIRALTGTYGENHYLTPEFLTEISSVIDTMVAV